MEQSATGQFIFKRMLLYHWFRQGDNYQTASRKLCRDYGERFVSLKLARQTYECFRRPDFDFERFSKGEPGAETENDYIEVSDMVIDLDDEQANAVDSILQEYPSKQSKDELAYPESIEIVSSSPVSAEKVPHQSTSQSSTPPHSVTSGMAPKKLEELRLYFMPSLEMSKCKPRIIRRWRVRRCFESSYTARETEITLNSLFGDKYVDHHFINKWFGDFEQGYRAVGIHNHKSGKKGGRLPTYDSSAIVSFFLQNPNASIKDCHKHFPKISSATICHTLKNNGFERRFNSWARRDPNEPEVSDEQLAEYKLRHPDAKAWEIGQHFGIFHIGIDSRLRALGFNVPEYPKRSQKKKSNNDHAPGEPDHHDDSSNSSIVNELSELMFELDGDTSSSADTQNASLLNFNRKIYTPKRQAHKGGRPQNSKNIANKNRLIDPLTGQPITSIIDPAFVRLKNNSSVTDKKKSKDVKEPKMSEELLSILNPAFGSPALLPPIPKPEIVPSPKKRRIQVPYSNIEELDKDRPLSPDNFVDELVFDPSSNTFISKRMKLSAKKGKKFVYTDPDVLDLPDEPEEDSSISFTFDPLSNIEENLEEMDKMFSGKKRPLSTSAKSNVVKVKIDLFPAEKNAKKIN